MVHCGVKEEELEGRLSVDRKNNELGYNLNNITWACRTRNTIKNNIFSYEEMIEIVTAKRQTRKLK